MAICKNEMWKRVSGFFIFEFNFHIFWCGNEGVCVGIVFGIQEIIVSW